MASPHRRWPRNILIILAVIALIGGFIMWKTGTTLNKISGGGVFESLVQSLPGVESMIRGEEEGRINIVLLGMRGENIPGGGLLTDTIIVASVKPAEKKASLVSVPRDLYVTVPGTSDQQKINAVHFYGEERGRGQGLEAMKTALSEVTGVDIHYAVSINFEGFKQIIDDLGGIDIVLPGPFSETAQFDEPHVCDPHVFTEPTGEFEHKIDDRGKIVASYPLCLNPDKECGGTFELPAGQSHLDGDTALCYARSRATSSDFDRARRQQEVLKAVQKKALSVGTLTDFGKMNALLSTAGDNIRTDMKPWEMKRLFEIYQEMGGMPEHVVQKVLENSEEGLLYVPPGAGPGDPRGYILLPRGDTYDRIHALFREVL